MSTVWVHPDVPKWWGRTCVHHVRTQVAFVKVLVVGISWKSAYRDCDAECIQQFIDHQGWNGRAVIDTEGMLLRRGANGLVEHTGDRAVNIIWEWSQVTSWLMSGWPTMAGDRCWSADGPVGTWCYEEGFDHRADHISRDPNTGWVVASKQMRSMSIPKEVRELRRTMNEHEAVAAMCGALKKHRVKLDTLHH